MWFEILISEEDLIRISNLFEFRTTPFTKIQGHLSSISSWISFTIRGRPASATKCLSMKRSCANRTRVWCTARALRVSTGLHTPKQAGQANGRARHSYGNGVIQICGGRALFPSVNSTATRRTRSLPTLRGGAHWTTLRFTEKRPHVTQIVKLLPPMMIENAQSYTRAIIPLSAHDLSARPLC